MGRGYYSRQHQAGHRWQQLLLLEEGKEVVESLIAETLCHPAPSFEASEAVSYQDARLAVAEAQLIAYPFHQLHQVFAQQVVPCIRGYAPLLHLTEAVRYVQRQVAAESLKHLCGDGNRL